MLYSRSLLVIYFTYSSDFLSVPIVCHNCSVPSHLQLYDPMDYSTLGLCVPHHLPEFAQVHVHCIDDAIQPSLPLTPSSTAVNLTQYQGLFQWAGYSHEMTKTLKLPLSQLHLTINEFQHSLCWTSEISHKALSCLPFTRFFKYYIFPVSCILNSSCTWPCIISWWIWRSSFLIYLFLYCTLLGLFLKKIMRRLIAPPQKKHYSLSFSLVW